MPVQISHLKIDRRRVWGASDQSLALIEKYRREGVDVTADQYPYDRASTNLGIRLPSWALASGCPDWCSPGRRDTGPRSRRRLPDGTFQSAPAIGRWPPKPAAGRSSGAKSAPA